MGCETLIEAAENLALTFTYAMAAGGPEGEVSETGAATSTEGTSFLEGADAEKAEKNSAEATRTRTALESGMALISANRINFRSYASYAPPTGGSGKALTEAAAPLQKGVLAALEEATKMREALSFLSPLTASFSPRIKGYGYTFQVTRFPTAAAKIHFIAFV